MNRPKSRLIVVNPVFPILANSRNSRPSSPAFGFRPSFLFAWFAWFAVENPFFVVPWITHQPALTERQAKEKSFNREPCEIREKGTVRKLVKIRAIRVKALPFCTFLGPILVGSC